MRNLEEILSPLIDRVKYTGTEYPIIDVPTALHDQLGLTGFSEALGLPIEKLFRVRYNGERFYFAKPGIWSIEGKPVMLFGFDKDGPTVVTLNPAGYLIKQPFGHVYEVNGIAIPVWVQSEVIATDAVLPVASLPMILKELNTGSNGGGILPRLIDSVLAIEGSPEMVLTLHEVPEEMLNSRYPRFKVTGSLSHGSLSHGGTGTWQVPGRLGGGLSCGWLLGDRTFELVVKQSKNGPYIDI